VNRRALLALLATGAAGCVGDRPTGDEPSTDAETPTASTRSTPTASPTPTAVSPPDVAPAPGDCPGYGDPTVVCTGAADDPPLEMDRSVDAADLPADLTFTLRNETEATFSTNFYAWRLWKRVDGRWFDVAPQFWPEPLHRLRPGASHAWTVSLDAALPDGPVARAQGESSVSLAALGGGRYAFGVRGWFGEHEDRYAAVAPVDLRADPLSLRPTDAVTDVRVDGDDVAARLDRDVGDARAARYALSRVGDDPGVPRRIAEQVVRAGLADEPLRDALALADDHDARTVELRGPTTTIPPFGVDDDGRRFRYEGLTYDVRAAFAGTTTG
jgi:hypothetical protein